MSNEVSISQEQAEMIEAGAPLALEALFSTGEYEPTLYVHNGEEVTYFSLPVHEVDELRAAVRQVIAENASDSLAYVFFYDCTVETEDGNADVLMIETGDAEDEQAHEFARMYSRADGFVTPRMTHLGPAPNLLR